MSLLTSAVISELAIEMLRKQIVLAATVVRISPGEYAGRSGGIVKLSVPAPRKARKQATPGAAITVDDLSENDTDVVVSHFYDAAPITIEDLSLAIVDFGRQVLRPQISAVATAAEEELAAAMNGVPADEVIEWDSTPGEAADTATLLAIRERLTTNGVPADGRFLAVAPDIATRLLSIPLLVRADTSGSVDALENATVGRVFGMTIVESASLDPGTSVGYHASGFALGNPVPADPMIPESEVTGGAASSVAELDGLALRHIIAFDAMHLTTLSVCSTFAGASVVSEDGPEIALAASESDDDIVQTAVDHGLIAGDTIKFGALTGGTGLDTSTTYHVLATGLTATAFKLSATAGGAAVNFTTDITAGNVKQVGGHDRAIRVVTGS